MKQFLKYTTACILIPFIFSCTSKEKILDAERGMGAFVLKMTNIANDLVLSHLGH